MTAEAEHYRDHRLSQPYPAYSAGTLLARKAVFETVGLFNPSLLHADKTEWFLIALENGLVIYVLPEVLAFRRFHKANLSRSLGAASREEYLKLLKGTLDRRRSVKPIV